MSVERLFSVPPLGLFVFKTSHTVRSCIYTDMHTLTYRHKHGYMSKRLRSFGLQILVNIKNESVLNFSLGP